MEIELIYISTATKAKLVKSYFVCWHVRMTEQQVQKRKDLVKMLDERGFLNYCYQAIYLIHLWFNTNDLFIVDDRYFENYADLLKNGADDDAKRYKYLLIIKLVWSCDEERTERLVKLIYTSYFSNIYLDKGLEEWQQKYSSNKK